MDPRLPQEFTAALVPPSQFPSRHSSVAKGDASDPPQTIPRDPDRTRYELPETIVDDAISLAAFLVIVFGGMFIGWGLA